MSWLHHIFLAFVGTLVVNVTAFVPPEYPSMELKMLAVIKTESEAPCEDCSGTLNETKIATYAESFLNILPTMVYNMTAGVVRLNTEVVVSPYKLMNISDNLMIQATNVPDDIELFNLTAANYDNVYILGPQTVWSAWGGQGPDMIGWSSTGWTEYHNRLNAGSVAIFLHEVLHPTMRWFQEEDKLGVSQSPNPDEKQMPEGDDGVYGDDPDGLHSRTAWNYTRTTGGDRGIPIIGEPFTNDNKWYMDILNGEICMQDGYGDCQDASETRPIGLGPNAWKYPSRREEYHGLPAGYLATYGTWPGEPATKSVYSGPSYTGFTSARDWKRNTDVPATIAPLPTQTPDPYLYSC